MLTEVGSKHYRRGVVLGLSLAELFTVLVFLLLLVLGSYSFILNEELDTKDELIADQRDVLVTLLRSDPESIQPAYPEELARIDNTKAIAELGAENRRLRDQLALKNEFQASMASMTRSSELPNGTLEQRAANSVPRGEYKRQQDTIDELISHTVELRKRIDQLLDPEQQKKLSQLHDELENLRRRNQELTDLIDAPSKIKQAIEESQELRTAISKLEEENEKLIQEKEAIVDQRGQDSPCWFRLGTRSNGESYERAEYIFDVRIDDQSIFVKNIEPPTSQYAAQKLRLRFDRESLNRNLSNGEFIRAFAPLKEDAENRKVRSDRRCTFYVAVWDATSETNKARYKNAHNRVVEAIFNTFEYQHEPWPH